VVEEAVRTADASRKELPPTPPADRTAG
jgi:hypothetical protein